MNFKNIITLIFLILSIKFVYCQDDTIPEKFIIHIAGEHQIELCKSFSKSADGGSEMNWNFNDEGEAFIKNCSARFECTKYSQFDGGDHSIIVGEVQKFETTDNKPLVYLEGNYQKL